MKALEDLAPLGLSEPWDRSGLQVGDPSASVRDVLVALDATPAAVAEARRRSVQLLVTHHPLSLEPLGPLDLSTAIGSLTADLIRAGVGLYACHTNLDRADGGVNDRLAALLGLVALGPLEAGEELWKLAVTVPAGYEPRLLRALERAGAGRLGNYDGCSFAARGLGRFRPGASASPFLGRAGALEEVPETRIEVVVAKSRVARVRAAVLGAHPYEEVALDLYRLEGSRRGEGLGRVGTLPEETSLGELAADVAKRLRAPGVRIVGNSERRVRRVAVCGGSGAGLWQQARSRGADCLVTGDVRYHAAREVVDGGFALIDAGHAATEWGAVDVLADALEGWARAECRPLVVHRFLEPEPFGWVPPRA